MIKRAVEKDFLAALSEYAVVTVFGPRQSGKTTLAKACCPEFNYVNLEDKEAFELARDDYKAFFRRYTMPLIIDEVQRLPEILAQVQVSVPDNLC